MAEDTPESRKHSRWAAKPFLSVLLRMFVFLAPMAASFITAISVGRAVPRGPGAGAAAVWWGSVLLTSFAALFVVERLVRRLTPVAVLLKLTLTFPDRAPSRYRVARRSGNISELRQSLERARHRTDKQSLDEIAETILSLATALSTHDRLTRGHSERVRVFTDMLAEELKVPVAERNRLRWAALLHDIGKLDVPAKILNKPDKLDDREWEVIKGHPKAGLRFIGSLGDWLGPHATTILHHHERFDGRGYPEGVGGHEIALGARIVSVADAFDTMTAARPYKKPLSAAAARQELSRCAGGQFDPMVVRAMLSIALGRLWWRVGIFSWLAQLPLVGPASQVLGRTMEAAIGAARTVSATASIGVAAVAAPLVANAARQDSSQSSPPAVVTQADGSSADSGLTDATLDSRGSLEDQGPATGGGRGETSSDAATGAGAGSIEPAESDTGGSGNSDAGGGSSTDQGSSGSGDAGGSGSGNADGSGSGNADGSGGSGTSGGGGGNGGGIGGGDGSGGGGGVGGGNPGVGGGNSGSGNSGSGGSGNSGSGGSGNSGSGNGGPNEESPPREGAPARVA